MPGKRSDPSALRKQREAILKDLEQRQGVPQRERMFPTDPMEQMRRFGVGVQSFLKERAARRETAKNPPPTESGARVIGYRRGGPV